MFGLFNKKKPGLVVHDKIYLSDEAKFKALLNLKKLNPNIVLVAWFEETKNDLDLYFKNNQCEAEVFLADRLGLMQQDKELIFVEHHPLQKEEDRVIERFGKKEMTFYSALSEPIFSVFGGEKLLEMMHKMGVEKDEVIEHDMITRSIMKAQEKFAYDSTQNSSAKSQREWLENAGHL